MTPYPAYKDSGVEWIGEVPAHWTMRIMKRVARIINGSTPNSGVAEYWNGDLVWVTPADISKLQTNRITDSKKKITKEGLESCGTRIVPKGSVILTTRAPIGNVGVADIPVCTNQGCKSLVPFSIDSLFLFYYL